MQVDKAFGYLQQSEEADAPDIRYTAMVKRSSSGTTGRGIYLREPLDTTHRLTYTAQLQPRFHEVRLSAPVLSGNSAGMHFLAPSFLRTAPRCTSWPRPFWEQR